MFSPLYCLVRRRFPWPWFVWSHYIYIYIYYCLKLEIWCWGDRVLMWSPIPKELYEIKQNKTLPNKEYIIKCLGIVWHLLHGGPCTYRYTVLSLQDDWPLKAFKGIHLPKHIMSLGSIFLCSTLELVCPEHIGLELPRAPSLTQSVHYKPSSNPLESKLLLISSYI